MNELGPGPGVHGAHEFVVVQEELFEKALLHEKSEFLLASSAFPLLLTFTSTYTFC